MNNEITLRLNSPITNEQWDAITDVDFEHTDRIRFHTKHGKDVEFVKDSSALHESCTDCPEYDHDRHSCPRFNKVIPTAILDAQPEIIRCRDCKHYNAGFECLIEGYGIERNEDFFVEMQRGEKNELRFTNRRKS